MFKWILEKITYTQYNSIVTAVAAILVALSQFGIETIDSAKLQMLAGAIWVILEVIGAGVKISDKITDVHNEVINATNLSTENTEKITTKIKVFKSK